MKKLNQFQIKIFMVILMVLDHIDYFIPTEMGAGFHVLTRCVGVWFGYSAVEGFIHTRNRKRYIGRLFGWATIMYAGNSVLNFLYGSKEVHIVNNIFLTLALGVLILYILSLIKGKTKLQKVLLVSSLSITIILGFIFTEGGNVVIPFMLITYYSYNNSKLRNILYFVLSGILFTIVYVPYDTLKETILMLAFNSDFMFITVIPFIYMYNKQRGSNSKLSKYFFYVFYPLHLWIIMTVTFLVK